MNTDGRMTHAIIDKSIIEQLCSVQFENKLLISGKESGAIDSFTKELKAIAYMRNGQWQPFS
jgi:hypothetical protein